VNRCSLQNFKIYLISNNKMISSFSFRGRKRLVPVYLRGFHRLSAVCANFLFEAERISRTKYDKIVHQHSVWIQNKIFMIWSEKVL
jgi:hypothetical protein